jgi:hypothetical protein
MFVPCGQTLSRSTIRVSNQHSEHSSETIVEERNPESSPGSRNGEEMSKVDAFTEIYLWNLNMDRLIRVLERLEPHSIRSQRELKAYAIRLEEIRAGLNADFAEVMVARERADEFRFWSWRIALERQTERAN